MTNSTPRQVTPVPALNRRILEWRRLRRQERLSRFVIGLIAVGAASIAYPALSPAALAIGCMLAAAAAYRWPSAYARPRPATS